MTGFGRGELNKDGKKAFVEIKSVNHRYMDYNIKMSKRFGFLENAIKDHIKKYIKRGKLDIYITYDDETESVNAVKINKPLLEDYLVKLNSISSEYDINNDISISLITKLPDVLSLENQGINEEELWDNLSVALDEALNNLIKMREQEGNSLLEDLLMKLNNMESMVSHIEKRAPFVVSEYKVKLEDRLNQLTNSKEVDEARIATEIAIFADRCSIDEELVRLKSHIKQMRETFGIGNSIGRKLDFLAQEMNREANTIASKSNDIVISQSAIDLKGEIEKIREQIQNIE